MLYRFQVQGAAVERQDAQVSGIMSSVTFQALDVAEATRRAIADMGHVQLTEVQARTIPALLLGRDVLGAAKTGSGKTLVRIVPKLVGSLQYGTASRQAVPTLSLERQQTCHMFGTQQGRPQHRPSISAIGFRFTHVQEQLLSFELGVTHLLRLLCK